MFIPPRRVCSYTCSHEEQPFCLPPREFLVAYVLDSIAEVKHDSFIMFVLHASWQEEKNAADVMQKMSKLAKENAAYNPNLSVGVVLGVDQPTIVDSEDEGDWSD